MAQLFDCSTDNIGLHLKNIFTSGELDESSVTEKSSATAVDGKTYAANDVQFTFPKVCCGTKTLGVATSSASAASSTASGAISSVVSVGTTNPIA